MRGFIDNQEPSTVPGEAQRSCRRPRRRRRMIDRLRPHGTRISSIERRPNRSNPTGQINGWKTILNAVTMHYGDRIEAARQP